MCGICHPFMTISFFRPLLVVCRLSDHAHRGRLHVSVSSAALLSSFQHKKIGSVMQHRIHNSSEFGSFSPVEGKVHKKYRLYVLRLFFSYLAFEIKTNVSIYLSTAGRRRTFLFSFFLDSRHPAAVHSNALAQLHVSLPFPLCLPRF